MHNITVDPYGSDSIAIVRRRQAKDGKIVCHQDFHQSIIDLRYLQINHACMTASDMQKVAPGIENGIHVKRIVEMDHIPFMHRVWVIWASIYEEIRDETTKRITGDTQGSYYNMHRHASNMVWERLEPIYIDYMERRLSLHHDDVLKNECVRTLYRHVYHVLMQGVPVPVGD